MKIQFIIDTIWKTHPISNGFSDYHLNRLEATGAFSAHDFKHQFGIDVTVHSEECSTPLFLHDPVEKLCELIQISTDQMVITKPEAPIIPDAVVIVPVLPDSADEDWFVDDDPRHNFAANLRPATLELLRSKEAKLVIDYSHEGFDLVATGVLEGLLRTLETYDIPIEQTCIITPNQIQNESYRQRYGEDFPVTLVIAWLELSRAIYIDWNRELPHQVNNSAREKIFLSLINFGKPHRVAVCADMVKHSWKDKCYASFLTPFPDSDWTGIESIAQEYDTIFIDPPWIVDIANEAQTAEWNANDRGRENTGSKLGYFENNSYIDLVTETQFHEPDIHYITEKTAKPILFLKPFILFGTYKFLHYLHNLGFQTFDKWWDESYDNIADPANRLRATLQLARELSTKPLTEHHHLRMEMREVLEHNRQILVNYLQDEDLLVELAAPWTR